MSDEFAIADGLSVVVSAARFHDVEVTLLVSHGLMALQQQECVFALKHDSGGRSDGEEVVAFVAKYLRTVQRLASEGRYVHAGGLSQLNPGAAVVDGVGFAPVRGVSDSVDAAVVAAGVAVDDALFAVPLRGAEVAMVAHAGVARVAARMGFAERFFPFAPWLDVDRAPVVDDADVAHTLIGNRTPSPLALPNVRIELDGDRIVITATALVSALAARAMVLSNEPGGGILCLANTTMGIGAQAALVYERGAKSPKAITAATKTDTTSPAPSRTAGSFVVVVTAASAGSIVEDGFFVAIPADKFAGLKDALARGVDLDIAAGEGGFGLSLRILGGAVQ